MAHKLYNEIPTKKKNRFSLPDFSGRFGFSFFIGSKELFIGLMLSDVTLEKVIRRRVVKISPAKVRTFGFDPLAENT